MRIPFFFNTLIASFKDCCGPSSKCSITPIDKYISIEFLVIGNFDYELNGVNLEVIKWKKKTEIEDLHTFDIGVYPLIKDQWALGKGALKAMQYMAIGIPTVATNYGTNPQVIDNNENGILVDSSKEWLEKLEYLILNPNERERIGINARKKIVNYYSVKSLEHLYLEVLRESNNEPV